MEGLEYAPHPSCVFKGIPFAKPPVGALRFKPPQNVAAEDFMATAHNHYDKESGVFKAHEYSAGCMQKCHLQHPEISCPAKISEDCLYLNVYTPKLSLEEEELKGNPELLPVMFWIHGGNYDQGAGGVSVYHGSHLASQYNVVVVSINYRLGAFGGLAGADGTLLGNYNLQDQRKAMMWVKENIRAFYGNPDLVTIFGQSAGGFSVGTHLASPKSWPYFHRAIMQSNPLSLPTETIQTASTYTEAIAKKLNCEKPTGTETADCLRQVPAEILLDVQKNTSYPTELHRFLHKFMPWTPIVDGDELPMSVMRAAQQNKLAPGVPIMHGTVRNEAVQFVWGASPGPMTAFKLNELLDAVFGFKNAAVIKELYGQPENTTDTRPYFYPIVTDFVFRCSGRNFSKMLANKRDIFRYQFDHFLSYTHYFQNAWYPECDDYICHGAELPMLFNIVQFLPRFAANMSKEEYILEHQMRAVWTNFAKTGTPNKPVPVPGQADSPKAFVFDRYNSTRDEGMHFQAPKHSKMEAKYREKFCDTFDTIGYYFG